MKKLVSLLMALVLVFAMSSVAMAATPITTLTELENAFANSGEYVLEDSFELNSGLTIDAGNTVTLDLNGHELSYTATHEDGSDANTNLDSDALITNNGTLIIKDSSDGLGKIYFTATNPDTTKSPAYASNLITNFGTVTIYGGVLENAANGSACHVVDNNSISNNVLLNVYGGELIAVKTAVRLFLGSTTNTNDVVVDGGTITAEGYRAINVQSVGDNVNTGSVTVKDGELNGQLYVYGKKANIDVKIEGGSLDYLYLYSTAAGDGESGLDVEISGGTITGDEDGDAVEIWNATDAKIELDVTGGNILGNVYLGTSSGCSSSNVAIKITGGTFPAGSNLLQYKADGVEFKEHNGKIYIGDAINSIPAPKRYDVNVADAANGDVTVKGSASYDSGVIITANPYYGYEVGKVTVTDANGKDVKVTNRADGTYSFSMPRGEVTIKVTFVPQGEAVKMVLTIGSKDVVVNGAVTANDVAPVIKNSRTFLPVRLIAENLGATVEWNNAAQTVTVTKGDTVIVLTVGSTTVTVNGQPAELEAAVFIENSRTYLPVRFIAEKLGADVEWNGATNEVTITGRK